MQPHFDPCTQKINWDNKEGYPIPKSIVYTEIPFKPRNKA